MKNIQKYPKAMILVLVLAVMFVFLLPENSYSEKLKAEVAMEVHAGFDGVAKLGAHIPYSVLVINKGRAIEGEVHIEVKIDSVNKTVFSKPVSLAEGASKEIVISAPVFTARRGVQIKFQENGRTIKEVDYAFTRLVPPDIKTIGVLSSDNSAYDYLNSLMIPMSEDNGYYEKEMAMKAAGAYPPSTTTAIDSKIMLSTKDVESVLIPLTGKEFPEDITVMNGFDILIMSNFDTSTLTKNQLYSLENWVIGGGTLVLGTGANWKKSYSSLPEELKKFYVKGISSKNSVSEFDNFINIKTDNDLTIDVVTGDMGFENTVTHDIQTEDDEKSLQENIKKASLNINEVLVGGDTNPLALKYIHQAGRILFLTFDPGMEPFISWEGRTLFWQNLLYHSSARNNTYQRGNGFYFSNSTNSNYYLNDLANQVPVDRVPPFLFMFAMLGVYIAIVGPIMYIFLKKKDKRDYSWVAIPAVAVLSLAIIYFAGFKTRYKTAVFNTASIIHLDTQNQKTDITTGMGIFNNKRGDLKLTYSQSDNISFDITQSGSNNYVSYDESSVVEGKIVSKITFSEPLKYELYDVSMWEPKYISAMKSEPFNDTIINSVQIKDGKIKMVINNTTKYDLLEAFISIGTNFISIGDILSGDSKSFEHSFESAEVYESLTQYLDAKYGRSYYPSNVTIPKDFNEMRRKRTAIENLFQRQYYNIKGDTVIGLYALNNQDLGYDIKINDEKPESYFTNGIFSTMDINFDKGQEIDIPSGIILPETDNFELLQRVAYMDGEDGIGVRDKGDIDFTYYIPNQIKCTELSLKFSTYIPLQIKYNIEDMKANNKNISTAILQNKYEYFIFNYLSGEWQMIDDSYTLKDDVEDYLNNENKLKVRIKVVEMAEGTMNTKAEYVESERLAFPALQLKGVVK